MTNLMRCRALLCVNSSIVYLIKAPSLMQLLIPYMQQGKYSMAFQDVDSERGAGTFLQGLNHQNGSNSCKRFCLTFLVFLMFLACFYVY